MLLDVVALSRNVRRNYIARAQLDTGDLALARVGLLGPHDTHAQADALLRRALRRSQRRRRGVASPLALPRPAEYLVQRRIEGRCGCEGAERGEGSLLLSRDCGRCRTAKEGAPGWRGE